MVIVKIDQGDLRGVLCKSDNVEYCAFKGIPYAQPPIGALRFKAPEPPRSWTGIRDAAQHGPVCPQYDARLDRTVAGSEDCLFINVYSKSLKPSQAMPVLVWIHGGGFYTGSGNSDFYGPEFFMEQDVVLVTFNYRLEVLGFLCLDNEDVPGNAGLKDQVMALKWVKHNISAFGGNPSNVTIFGCSAGAASTSYHLTSKMSGGLFNKAICQSGVCLNEWSYNLYAKKRAFQLGKLLGKETKDEVELLDFLKQLPASSLVNISLPALDVQHMDIADSIYFGPVIEKSSLKVEKFISETPFESLKGGSVADVPIIVGYTSAEGIETARKIVDLLNFLSKVGSVVPREIKLEVNEDVLKCIDQKIREKYFNSKSITNDMLQELTDLHTYSLFTYNIYRFAKFCATVNSNHVYLYKFSAETERNFAKSNYKMNHLKGVCHADELPYLFNVTCLDIPLTDNSIPIIKQIIGLWTSFARSGNPTESRNITWEPYSGKTKSCFIINKTCVCKENPDSEHIDFWEDIYANMLDGDTKCNI